MSGGETHLSVAEAYDRWSGTYDGYDNPMVFGATRIVSAVAGLDMLEIGCGTGRNLAAFRQGGARRLVGLDLSAGMLAKAAACDVGFELHRQDMAEAVPLDDASVDRVLFCLTLEHVADLAVPLWEARRVLKPGGRIEIIEIHPYLALGGVAAHFKAGDEIIHMPTVAHEFSGYLNAFAAAGLSSAACREWCPRDFGDNLPPKLLKRGPDTPLLVHFTLGKAG
jgi:malonyl-CoA O-methyltransferase